jgi:hypothetical protein
VCGLPVPILQILRSDGFCGGKEGASLRASPGRLWEMAMSELKQQSIALWILLMLLILVPWALE